MLVFVRNIFSVIIWQFVSHLLNQCWYTYELLLYIFKVMIEWLLFVKKNNIFCSYMYSTTINIWLHRIALYRPWVVWLTHQNNIILLTHLYFFPSTKTVCNIHYLHNTSILTCLVESLPWVDWYHKSECCVQLYLLYIEYDDHQLHQKNKYHK